MPIDFPTELLARAKTLGGELAWDAQGALRAIAWLQSKESLVLGVEMWVELHGAPRWIASSSYKFDSLTDWKERSNRCTAEAKKFVERFAEEPNALFNLTWTDKEDGTS